MIKKITVMLLLLTLVVVGAAFAQAPKKGGTLIFGRGGDSVGLDPAYESDGNSFMICDNVFEALVEYKDETTELEPLLATSWQISPDGLTYTFNLRKGVKFHDGTAFNADAVVFSIGRQMKEKKLKFFGKGWEMPKQERPPEYWNNMAMDKTVDSIEAQDEYTVVFKLKTVEAPFLANLGMDFADIISPTAFMKDPAAFVRNPVGTGPYKFVNWVKDDRITLEAFKDYWAKDKGPYMDKVIFRAIPENAVRFLELKAGKIHICQFPNAADIPMAKKDPKLWVPTQPGMNIGYLGFNHKKEPWKSNKNLRLSHCPRHQPKGDCGQHLPGHGRTGQELHPSHHVGIQQGVAGLRVQRGPRQRNCLLKQGSRKERGFLRSPCGPCLWRDLTIRKG